MFDSLFFCLLEGVDEVLSKHIAHLFIRDPISLFAEKIEPADENDTDHFEVSSYVSFSVPFTALSIELFLLSLFWLQCQNEGFARAGVVNI